jgi:predicted glycoside hydrolase/deacetylase ChbG (UPF0249 family)
MKPIIISADDFAQSAAIDEGIIALILQKRLSAMSCLTSSPRWLEAARLITPEIRQAADIGVHLDFTQFAKSSRKTLGILILRSLLRTLSQKEIASNIHHQLDQYELALRTPPDYIDGHQHIHQLPQIRDSLLEIILKRYSTQLPWIRIAAPPLRFGFKGKIIGLLGSSALRKKANVLGFKYTSQLLGVYNFEGNTEDYRERFENWMHYANHASPQERIALMCHPAIVSYAQPSDIDDPISNARIREYTFFANDNIAKILGQNDLFLTRGSSSL